MITPKDILKDLTHDYSGNNFVVVQFLPHDFCRVTDNSPPPAGKSRQFFLAWTKKLKPTLRRIDPLDQRSKMEELPILPEIAVEINKIRADLESGKARIESTRLVRV